MCCIDSKIRKYTLNKLLTQHKELLYEYEYNNNTQATAISIIVFAALNVPMCSNKMCNTYNLCETVHCVHSTDKHTKVTLKFNEATRDQFAHAQFAYFCGVGSFDDKCIASQVGFLYIKHSAVKYDEHIIL